MDTFLPLVVLVTTTDRPAFHHSRTIPSLLSQTVQWDDLYVIDDSKESESNVGQVFGQAQLPGLNYSRNVRTIGAAGSWNTGLGLISQKWSEAWVAILDDDDKWDPCHLETCRKHERAGVDAIISGIATYGHESLLDSEFNKAFNRRSFLSGNPGWQGSNTYARLSRLLQVGGFDEELICTHDRDLALRLMALPGFELIRTGRRTVWYMMDRDVPAYTRTGNPEKLEGLRFFLRKHLHEMTADDVQHFMLRAQTLFGFTPDNFDDLA
jgi:glycosyltransferase involved in cell wall biosynthesis